MFKKLLFGMHNKDYIKSCKNGVLMLDYYNIK
jgi:hypothetical protein